MKSKAYLAEEFFSIITPIIIKDENNCPNNSNNVTAIKKNGNN